MNAHDVKPNAQKDPVDLVLAYLRNRFRAPYEFEIRDGVIWERFNGGTWHDQKGGYEYWHEAMTRDGWPIA